MRVVSLTAIGVREAKIFPSFQPLVSLCLPLQTKKEPYRLLGRGLNQTHADPALGFPSYMDHSRTVTWIRSRMLHFFVQLDQDTPVARLNGISTVSPQLMHMIYSDRRLPQTFFVPTACQP